MIVNYFGTLNTIKAILPHMLERGSGHIVITNSLDSKKGVVGDGPYVAAKSALRGLGDVLRPELKASVTVPGTYALLGPLNDLFPRLMDRVYARLKLEGKPVKSR